LFPRYAAHLVALARSQLPRKLPGHAELAEHFRGEEWHPNGCWVVDLILAKG